MVKNPSFRYFTVLSLLFWLSFLCTGCGLWSRNSMRIGEYVVSGEEYEFFYDMQKARASGDFYAEYRIDVSKGERGWQTPNEEGLTAEEYANELTRETIVRYVSVRSLAEERGIPVWEGFEALQQRAAELNEAGTGPTGYGMTRWTEESLFLYLYQDLENQLLRYMAENEFDFTEDQTREAYGRMDITGVAMRGDLQATVDICYCFNPGETDSILLEDALDAVYEAWRRGEDIADVREGLNLQILTKTQVSTKDVGRDDMFTQTLLTELFSHEKGDIFRGEFAGLPSVCRVREIERQEGDFESSKDLVRNYLIREQYEKAVEQRMQNLEEL